MLVHPRMVILIVDMCIHIYIYHDKSLPISIDDHHPIRPNMGQFSTSHHIQCSDYDDRLQLRQRWLFSRYPAKNYQQFHWLVYIVYCVHYPVIATETGWFSQDTARTCFLFFSGPGGCIFIQTCTASAGWFTWFHIWMECKNNSHHNDNDNSNDKIL